MLGLFEQLFGDDGGGGGVGFDEILAGSDVVVEEGLFDRGGEGGKAGDGVKADFFDE
jgi:hypothetical protein